MVYVKRTGCTTIVSLPKLKTTVEKQILNKNAAYTEMINR